MQKKKKKSSGGQTEKQKPTCYGETAGAGIGDCQQSRGKQNQQQSTYNRKQRNFTCSVVLMHQKIRDRKQTDGEKNHVNTRISLVW